MNTITITIFYQLIIIAHLKQWPSWQVFKSKARLINIFLLAIISVPMAYLLWMEAEWTPLAYIIISYLLSAASNNASIAWKFWWPLNIPIIIFFLLPVFNLGLNFYSTANQNLLLLYGASILAWTFYPNDKISGISHLNNYTIQGLSNTPYSIKPLLSTILIGISCIILLLEIITPNTADSRLQLDQVLWHYYFSSVILFEFLTKIGFQSVIMQQFAINNKIIKITLSSIVSLLLALLLMQHSLYFSALLVSCVLGCIIFELWGMATTMVFHSLLWLIAYYLWQISI